MSDQETSDGRGRPPGSGRDRPDAAYEVQTTSRLTLHSRVGAIPPERLTAVAEVAERVARHVDGRLSTVLGIYAPRSRADLYIEAGAPDPSEGAEAPARLSLSESTSEHEIGVAAARALIVWRFGGPEFWTADPAASDPAVSRNVVEFLLTGLSLYLASQALEQPGGRLFGDPAGRAPRQGANQVVRQAAADREGKLPLYESLIRGTERTSGPPEFLALAESFSGYLFEREGAKAFRRFVDGCRQNLHAGAEVVFGKSVEQLQDEWIRATLYGQSRRPVALKSFAFQIFPYLRPYKWLVIQALGLMLLAAGVAQVSPFVLRDIVDIVTGAAGKGDPRMFGDFLVLVEDVAIGKPADFGAYYERNALVFQTLGRLYGKILVLIISVFVNLCAITWMVYTVGVVSQNILRDLRIAFTGRLHNLGAGFYSRHRMGDMIARFTSDIARMAEPLTEATAYSIYYIIFLTMSTWSMFNMSWQLSLVLFIVVPVYFAINRRFGPAMQVAARSRQERLAQLNAALEEMLFGHSLIKSYGLGHHLMQKFRPKIGEFRKVAIWTDFLRGIYKEVISIAENIQTKLVFALGGTLAVFGLVTTGTIIGFNSLAARFLSPLHNLGLIYAGVAVASASLRRVEEILREPAEPLDIPAGGSFGPTEVRDGVTFEHVSFSYSGVTPTLTDINVRIPAGSKLAFVGPTGAGKSTLVNLIPRFYDVDSGAIRIDGRDIRSFSLVGLRQAISIVSQDTFIFNATLMENIRIGRLDATDEEVFEAARGARLHSFIETLPAGYETLAGERGSRLSGGQRQRVAIARALLRQSPILILDEATSSLDAETESEILAELDEVTRGKTVISITHRLGLAIKSDTICVLQAGQIVQLGSHEELIAQTGLYRKLFEDQNRDLMQRGAGDQLAVTVNRLRSVPSSSLVPTREVETLAHLLRRESYAAGEEFCDGTEAVDKLYVLRCGQVELLTRDEHGTEQRLIIGAGAAENGGGKMSLLLNIPHAVRARALTDTEIEVLHDDDLRGLLGAAWQSAEPTSAGAGGDGNSSLPRAALGQWVAERVREPAG